jgi:twitching motility protein PilT
MESSELFKRMVERGASDLHLQAPGRPILRVHGCLVPQEDMPCFSPEDVERVFESITTEQQRETFYTEQELDLGYSVTDLARFRINVLRQRGSISLSFRLVPFDPKSIGELGLPKIMEEYILKPRGLILVTGPTGSGKSTTLAAMIDHLNSNEARTIITIEDPIEHIHRDKKCLIAQRELGGDTRSFATALKYALRHDPDVIVVGEMRDEDTMATAITAAETGHLVLGTLHTIDAPQTVDRLISMFPPSQQPQIRLELSQVMEAVFSQVLLPRLDCEGRVPACEIMIANSPVRNLIREARTFELHNTMQLSRKDGMQILNQSLADLVKERVVSPEEAMMRSSRPAQLKQMLGATVS